MTGIIVSLLLIIMSISYPSLIFTGNFDEYFNTGVQMALFSAAVLCIVLSLLSTCPGVAGVAQGETAAVLGLATASIAGDCGASCDAGQLLPTVMAIIVISSLLIGFLFVVLGGLRLGNIIRFVPLPVMGGFLAGVGWLLLSGAFRSMTGLPQSDLSLTALFQAHMVLKWLPGLLSALVLLALQRRRKDAFNLIIVVLATVALFWLAIWIAGLSAAALRADGWFMAAGNITGNWTPFDYAGMIDNIDWGAIWSQMPQLGSLLVIASICILMAASSLEIISGKDMDLNRELLAAGVGNFVCAAAGSLPGYHSLAASTLSQKMDTPVRTVGLVSAGVCILAYALGTSFLLFLPKALVGTVILYISLSLLTEWLYDVRFKLSPADYALLLLVFGFVGFVGLIAGVVMGIIAGLVRFAFDYGRISIAREVGSSVNIRSNIVYPEAKNAALREHGAESFIVRLQGFIFFGTANRLLDQIRSRMLNPDEAPLRCVALDFRRVSGLDASAAFSFLKLRQYAASSGFVIALSRLSPRIDKSLRLAGAFDGPQACIHTFEDLDRALEYCEQIIISAHLPRSDEADYPISEQLRRAFSDERHAEALSKHLRKMTFQKGDYLVRQDEGSDALYFIERGRVAVMLEKPGLPPVRINSMGPGTIVGEIAFLLRLPRAASVVAESELAVHRLTREDLDVIAARNPEIIIAFQGYVLRILAERLFDFNRLFPAE